MTARLTLALCLLATASGCGSSDVDVVSDEGEEEVADRFVPLYARIGQMTIAQKIRIAMLGTAAERMLLLRDSNRLVATAQSIGSNAGAGLLQVGAAVQGGQLVGPCAESPPKIEFEAPAVSACV